MGANPYEKYRQQSINTMTQGELLNLLFETCSKRINLGIKYIEEKDYEKADENLNKAKKIITYLDGTLDRQYEISENLSALYDFFNRQIFDANISKDVNALREVESMISDLGKTFRQAEVIARKQSS